MYKIPFNRPFIVGKEVFYIAQAVINGHISADGVFTKKCTKFFENRYGIEKVLLTPSCTAALEMAAILCDLKDSDEVILPSFTFVSTVNAIVRVGAKPVFVDIREDTLNMNELLIEPAITQKTKMILPVHYAGVGCEMNTIMAIANQHNLKVVEDAAQGVEAFYNDSALGSIGHLGAFSFHETKNYICGEGGAICINDPNLIERAEIIRDKGTNRQKYYRGEIDKYTWVDVGSSYVPSEICGAFLWAQLEQVENIAKKRMDIYERYYRELTDLEEKGLLALPKIPKECKSNYHMFYIILPSCRTRNRLMDHLKKNGILSVFHYIPLHSSSMGKKFGYKEGNLPITEDLSGRLLRLPFYYELNQSDQLTVINEINQFFK